MEIRLNNKRYSHDATQTQAYHIIDVSGIPARHIAVEGWNFGEHVILMKQKVKNNIVSAIDIKQIQHIIIYSFMNIRKGRNTEALTISVTLAVFQPDTSLLKAVAT